MKPGRISTFFIIVTALFIVNACTSRNPAPNKPFAGNYPDKFDLIRNSSPLLAVELGKIPEMQDGISKTEKAVLNQLIDLYMTDTKSFDKAFLQMYRVGLPKVRKYCTPLQAVFWLIQDGKSKLTENLLQNYSLKTLLHAAWGNLYSRTKKRGWNDFQTVADRLNSPELLDYYQRRVITYEYLTGFGEGTGEVFRVFKNKYGHCAQITAFTVYFLKRAGYDARKKIIVHPALKSPNGNDHRVSRFIVNGKTYIMDNGRRNPYGIIRFEDYDPMLHPYLNDYYKVWNEMSEI